MVGELRTAEEQADELRLLCEAYTRSLEKCLHTHTMPDEKKLVSGFCYLHSTKMVLIIFAWYFVYVYISSLLSCFSCSLAVFIALFVNDFLSRDIYIRNISEESARVSSSWRTEGVSQLFTIGWEPWTQRSAEVCLLRFLSIQVDHVKHVCITFSLVWNIKMTMLAFYAFLSSGAKLQ